MHFILLASTSESKDWLSLPRPVVEHPSAGSSCRERIRFWLAKVWSRRSRGRGISAQEGNRRGNRLAPAMRRVADIGGVIARPEESLPRTPVPAVPLPWAQERLCTKINPYVTADSRQNSSAAFDATISHFTRSRGLGTRAGSSPPAAPQRDFARGIAVQ